MKSYALTRQAQARLREIFCHTRKHWGRAQVQQYKENLLARLDQLCAGDPLHPRSCSALTAQTAEVENLFYFMEGRHYIIYLDVGEQLQVIDFVHGSRDLPVILQEIQAGLLK